MDELTDLARRLEVLADREPDPAVAARLLDAACDLHDKADGEAAATVPLLVLPFGDLTAGG